MKFLSIIASLFLCLSCFAQVSDVLHYNRFDTNPDTNQIDGSTLTNVYAQSLINGSTVTNETAQGILSIGGGYTFTVSTNVLGITNGLAQGTYQYYSSPNLYTNLNNVIWTIGNSSGTWYVYSNSVAWYSSVSLLGQYSQIGGTPVPPIVFQGGYRGLNGWIDSGIYNAENLTNINNIIYAKQLLISGPKGITSTLITNTDHGILNMEGNVNVDGQLSAQGSFIVQNGYIAATNFDAINSFYPSIDSSGQFISPLDGSLFLDISGIIHGNGFSITNVRGSNIIGSISSLCLTNARLIQMCTNITYPSGQALFDTQFNPGSLFYGNGNYLASGSRLFWPIGNNTLADQTGSLWLPGNIFLCDQYGNMSLNSLGGNVTNQIKNLLSGSYLTPNNVLTNLNIAKSSISSMNTNGLRLTGSAISAVNVYYQWNSSGFFTNLNGSSINYSTNTGFSTISTNGVLTGFQLSGFAYGNAQWTTNGSITALTPPYSDYFVSIDGTGLTISNVTISAQALTLQLTNIAPVDAVTPKIWFVVTNGTSTYKVAGYQ